MLTTEFETIYMDKHEIFCDYITEIMDIVNANFQSRWAYTWFQSYLKTIKIPSDCFRPKSEQ